MSNGTKSETKEVVLVPVRLLTKHNHKGIDLEPGTVIDVLPSQVPWLEFHKIGTSELVATAAAPAAATATTSSTGPSRGGEK